MLGIIFCGLVGVIAIGCIMYVHKQTYGDWL